MDDDSDLSRPPAQPKLSMTPSWVMLGFVLGALFVFALQPRENKSASPAPAPPAQPAAPAPPLPPPRLTTIEAVFADWGAFALWDNDTTEVALWNTDQRGYTDFHEVRRAGGTLYFRTIPRLTRRIVNRGKPLPESCPLQFTETEEHYREWFEHGRTERPSQTRRAPPRPVPATPVAPAIERAAMPPPRVEPPAPERVNAPLPEARVPKEAGRP
ncbi:MAG: hypothetical protein HY736_24285 [Verrucomicrobia bacterium]|nr:hypothetical protein [Verrucomicrobiota bacterium]